jgi:hypothetical protein
MANSKISVLTAATTPLAGTEVLPIVQSGATVNVSVSNLTVGRDVVAKTSSVTSGSFGGTFFNNADSATAASRYWKMQNDVLAYGDWVIAQSNDNTVTAFTTRVYMSPAGNMGLGTTSPAATAILDVQSTTKGIRFPNMTTVQKTAITPSAGTVIFDTTLSKLCVYSGSAWETITSV